MVQGSNMIDLKEEFEKLIYENEVSHWVVWRHFTGERTSDYNEAYKEDISGVKSKYIDQLIRAYSTSSSFGMAQAGIGITRVEPADISTESIVYYTRSEYDIKKEDWLFKLDWGKNEMPEIVYSKDEENYTQGKIMPKKRAIVMKIVDFASTTSGKSEFKKIFAEEHPV